MQTYQEYVVPKSIPITVPTSAFLSSLAKETKTKPKTTPSSKTGLILYVAINCFEKLSIF